LFNFLIFEINPNNIYNYKGRFVNYIYLEDKNFLDKETINFIENSKKYIDNYKCIQNFTNDVALNYLLKKENCSKFYMVFSLGSKKTQNELIKDLGKTDIVIAYKERKELFNHKDEPNYKLWIVRDYIKENFDIIYEEGDRIILKKNVL
jgi:hypothetical protein